MAKPTRFYKVYVWYAGRREVDWSPNVASIPRVGRRLKRRLGIKHRVGYAYEPVGIEMTKKGILRWLEQNHTMERG